MIKWTITLSSIVLIGCASWWQEDKTKADLYLRMGVAQMESNNYPYALRDLMVAEKLDPKNPVIQNNLGLVYFFRERYDLAEKHLRNAVRLDEAYTEARVNLSRVLLENGRPAEAEKEIKITLNDLTYPTPEKAYTNLGLVKFNVKDFPASRAAFKKVISSVQDDCIAYTYIGRSYFEEGDYSKASESLDRAVGFCQKNLYDEPHYYSALAYYRLGEKSKSIARFEELLKYYPNGKFSDKAKGMLSLIRKGN